MSEQAKPTGYSAGARLRLATVVVATLGAVLACEREEPLRLSVLFEQNHDVESGADVMYKDMKVGRVDKVGLDENGKVRLELAVDPQYRGAVAANSLVAVERAGVMGGRRLVVTDGSGERLPLAPGAVLLGHEEDSPTVLDRLRTAGQGAMARLGELGVDLERGLDELKQSPEADELRAAMTRLGEQAAEGSERLRAEGVEAVRQRAAELQRKLEAEGKTEEARDLAERVERWLEEAGGSDS
jgi:ABC-type transporter Mla subunit MlaD